ncbi:ESS family glutamate:Na+ symporter [Comamonas sp. BIGb0124]|uniref:sodium/glutamate symporter n=1 Tax=Comamonas sp. BIGb0124 TaxID=2485130 RepID=UPI000F46169E|nr:sodium/glutamate symporter [Comamonas sp. BIGb0124]ROR21694.1 ESS family glutamate:Na+ symporter [Comamonas sp. BIGb0124]
MFPAELIQVSAFHSFTLAIVLLFLGRKTADRWDILRRYSIPEPVVGGVICAVLVGVLYYAVGMRIEFELGMRDILLLYFFAGIGLKSDIQTVKDGGKPLMVLLAVAAVYIVLQNGVGMGVAWLFGLDARAGLMTGSVSLTGGVGTTLAWAPTFVGELGIANALELGMASNMVGLVIACVIGGPIASHLMRRHGLRGNGPLPLDGQAAASSAGATLDYYGVLKAWLWLNLALMLGGAITPLLARLGLQLPDFVGCLMAGIILRNLGALWLLRRGTERLDGPRWQSTRQGLSLISDICLGMFLTMALMGLQLWVLEGSLAFVLTALALQVALAVVYTVAVVYRCMGRDYESAVVSAGFGGIVLGSTATAVANMTAVARQNGVAPRAFLVVPLVCGFFIDIVNALIIQFLVRWA